MDTVKDIAALVGTVSIFVAISINRIAGTKFRRSVMKKMSVDRNDMLGYWRLGRWSCLLAAMAFGVLAPIALDSGGVEFSLRSLLGWSLVLATIGGAIMLAAHAAMTFGTKYSFWWRAMFLDWEDQ